MWGFEIFSRIAILLVLSLVIAACSPIGRQKILTTLFDGVPSEKIKDDMAILDTVNIIDSTVILTSTSTVAKEVMFVHEPFQNKSCDHCHDHRSMGKLVAEQPMLCHKCHDNQNENHSFQHGPAGAGICTSCHHPHKAKAKNLLHEDGEALCTMCHDTEDISNNKIHKGIKDKKRCLDCHDPHASDLRFMIKMGACKNCHQVNKEKFMHGPVASDYCSMCHDSHESGKDKLLLAEEQHLCMNCHEVSNVFNDELHKREANKNCTTCHNPHGGTEKFMLTK